MVMIPGFALKQIAIKRSENLFNRGNSMSDHREELIETLNQARVYLPIVARQAGMKELIAIGNLLVTLSEVVKGEVAERQLSWHFGEIHRAKEQDDSWSKHQEQLRKGEISR